MFASTAIHPYGLKYNKFTQRDCQLAIRFYKNNNENITDEIIIKLFHDLNIFDMIHNGIDRVYSYPQRLWLIKIVIKNPHLLQESKSLKNAICIGDNPLLDEFLNGSSYIDDEDAEIAT